MLRVEILRKKNVLRNYTKPELMIVQLTAKKVIFKVCHQKETIESESNMALYERYSLTQIFL